MFKCINRANFWICLVELVFVIGLLSPGYLSAIQVTLVTAPEVEQAFVDMKFTVHDPTAILKVEIDVAHPSWNCIHHKSFQSSRGQNTLHIHPNGDRTAYAKKLVALSFPCGKYDFIALSQKTACVQIANIERTIEQVFG